MQVFNLATGNFLTIDSKSDQLGALLLAHALDCTSKHCTANEGIRFAPSSIGYCDYAVQLDNTARYLWNKACEHDGMPLDTKFAAFSGANPWASAHDNVVRIELQWRKARQQKYKVVRMYKRGGRRTILSGITLEQAQDHCSNPESSSATATSGRANAITRRVGEWFDIYTLM